MGWGLGGVGWGGVGRTDLLYMGFAMLFYAPVNVKPERKEMGRCQLEVN